MTAFTGDADFGRDERVHAAGAASCSTRRAHRRDTSCSGRRTSTPPTRPACRASTWVSTSTEDDFTGRQIGSACGQEAWRSSSATSTARPADSNFSDLLWSATIPRCAHPRADRDRVGGGDRMHIRRSTALTVGVASVLAVGALRAGRQRHHGATGHRGRGGGGGDCVVGVVLEQLPGAEVGAVGRAGHARVRSRPVAAATSRPTPVLRRTAGERCREPHRSGRQRPRDPRSGRHGDPAVGGDRVGQRHPGHRL